MTRPQGPDVSHYDKSFTPHDAAVPIDFVIQKVSEGTAFDPLLEFIYAGVQEVPVRGAYHYFRSAVPWQSQADRFLVAVTPRNYHFHVLDFEKRNNEPSRTFAAMAWEWMKYIKAQTKQPVVLYSNPDTYQTWLLPYGNWMKEFPLWVAQYPFFMPNPQTASPRLPTGRLDWTFWQYSPGEKNAAGPAHGIGSRGVDLNVFNGTVEELVAWACVSGPPTPLPLTLEEKVERLWAAHPELQRGYQ